MLTPIRKNRITFIVLILNFSPYDEIFYSSFRPIPVKIKLPYENNQQNEYRACNENHAYDMPIMHF